MKIIVQKTGTIARSIAYQAKAVAGECELVAMFGTSEENARENLINELKTLRNELDALLGEF
jgi:hypothetical protein